MGVSLVPPSLMYPRPTSHPTHLLLATEQHSTRGHDWVQLSHPLCLHHLFDLDHILSVQGPLPIAISAHTRTYSLFILFFSLPFFLPFLSCLHPFDTLTPNPPPTSVGFNTEHHSRVFVAVWPRCSRSCGPFIGWVRHVLPSLL